MSAAQSAEAQARLQLSLRDIIEFFEKAGVEQHSVENLTEFISKNSIISLKLSCNLAWASAL